MEILNISLDTLVLRNHSLERTLERSLIFASYCFSWPDIVKMMHSKKNFSVETSSLKSVLEMVC